MMLSTMKREYEHDQSIFYDATPSALKSASRGDRGRDLFHLRKGQPTSILATYTTYFCSILKQRTTICYRADNHESTTSTPAAATPGLSRHVCHESEATSAEWTATTAVATR
jgi:hypothetical protein